MAHLTQNQKIGIAAVGSLTAGVLAVVITKKVMAKSAAVSTEPGGKPTQPGINQVVTYLMPVPVAANVQPGAQYIFAALRDPGQNRQAHVDALKGQFDNLNVIYFGGDPDPGPWPLEMPYPLNASGQIDQAAMAQLVVFSGIYKGPVRALSDIPEVPFVPTNAPGGMWAQGTKAAMVYLPQPVTLPTVQVATQYNGVPIVIAPLGSSGLVVGNAPCKSTQGQLVSPNLAVGSSGDEVVAKLQSAITAYGCRAIGVAGLPVGIGMTPIRSAEMQTGIGDMPYSAMFPESKPRRRS